MLLTITNTAVPAADLGHLLHKHPARVQETELSFGKAHIEVIEHLDPMRLPAFTRILFEYTRPKLVVVTTPNVEHNVHYPSLPAGQMRHHDHRFEWTRAEFQAWARSAAQRFDYSVDFAGVGPDDPVTGPPTQMGIFRRA